MDKLLRPERFNTEASAPNSENIYKHWKFTFLNYMNTVNATRKEDPQNDLLDFFALVNNISASIYSRICNINSLTAAIRTLDQIYIKPTNVVFNRHKLITHKQAPGQSIDDFMQEIDKIASTCDFRAVSADQHRNLYVRDALINGVYSSSTRQRLLERTSLNLRETFELARSLEQAENQAATYENRDSVAAPLTAPERAGSVTPDDNIGAVRKYTRTQELCYFCGLARHSRNKCPARDSQCRNCGKSGHWKVKCRSGNSAVIGNPGNSLPDLA